jgi:hypothetical protein
MIMHYFNMPENDSPILDWDIIVHKNVRSTDGQDVGNVDALYEDSIVPKSEDDGFNSAEVFLKLTIAELEKFKV